MRPFKIVLALLLTFALIIAVRYHNSNQYGTFTSKAFVEGITFTHSFPHYYHSDLKPAVLAVDVSGGRIPHGYNLGLYYKPEHIPGYEGEISFARYIMDPSFKKDNRYELEIPFQGRGSRVDYYIELVDDNGNTAETLISSENNSRKGWFVFAGERSLPVLIAHILTMFGGFLFLSMAFLTSFENLKNSVSNSLLGKQILWGTIFILLGTFPVGIWLQYSTIGTYWNGFPLGSDINNTIGLIIFAYWLIMIILMKGAAFGSKPSKNLVPAVLARILTMVGFLGTAGLYLVSHNMGEF